MKTLFSYLLLMIFLVGCIAGKGDIKINLKRNTTSSSPAASNLSSASVSSVQIINNQLVITGIGFDKVENIKVNGHSLNTDFVIESKSTNQIIANALSAFSFDVSKVFNLILSDANASATFPIDFSLCNATLNGKGFNCAITAQDKDVLSFDQATNKWKPRSINGLSYQGSWDATDPLPATTTAGDYFIVSVASAPYGVGDWIVWNGGSYDQVSNSTTITSVYGRTGAIVATEGDYDLNKLLDVDLTVAPTIGKVLKYDGTKWVAGDDLSGGGAGSVSTTEISDGAVTDVKINSISASKITGTITSSQILDGTIVNADINAAAAIDYSKLNIPNTTIPYAKLNIADGDIPAAKISGLPAATSVLATTIVDGDTTHAPDGNAVFDALALKLNLTGGTLSIGTISGVPTPTNSDDVANKGYTDTRDALKLAKAGDTMTGALTLDNDLLIKGGANYVTVKGHAASAAYNLVLPANTGTSGYVLSTDGSGNTSWVDVTSALTSLDTDDVAEGTRLYFTEARVLATDLAGLNTGVAGPIVATDTVLGAMGKLQYQANAVQAFAKSTLPTCAAGEVLKSNGTSFSCVVDNSGAGSFSGTANRAVVTDGGGALGVSATTVTELGYVSGVTSAIQTQLNAKEAAITAGTAAQYLNGEKNFATLDTLAVPENTRLYFTEPRVLATDLAGFVASNSAIVATDSLLVGLEKSQGQITNLNSVKANVAGDTFTGDVTFNTQVRLKDGAAADHITIKAPASGTTSHTLTLPATVGTSGQVLSMTGTAGVLAWTTPSSSAAPSGAAGGDLSGTYPNPTITGLDATKIATGVVDNTEFNYLNGVTSSIQTQLTGKQATDATLTALAAFNTDGIMVQTAADTFVGRSIAGTANRVTVTNGDGVAGNPTLDIPTSLLPSPVVGDVGKFLKATAADTSVWSTLTSSDITTALGFTPIDKAGDSITTGTFTLSGTAVLRTPDPVGLTDVANKQYVDSYGQWVKSGSDVYRSAGKVGVGTTTPQTALDVAGAVRLSDDATACTAANAGAIRYNSTLSLFEKCNGSQWFAESSGVPVPANTVVLMKACDASWTDNGALLGGTGNASCGGVSCHMCESPASPSLIPANSVVLMESCPANWTSLGAVSGGPLAGGRGGVLYQSCQSPATAVAMPQASRIMSVSCPANWADLGDTDFGPASVACVGGLSCKVCEAPSGNVGNNRLLYGGTAGATGNGGNVSVRGGAGGTTSGSGGSVSITGGTPIDGNGGGISLLAASGATTTATSVAGGAITLTAGSGVSGGAGGNVTVNSGVSDTGTQGHIILNNTNTATFVGIGTVSPQTKLDVSGSIRIGTDATACSGTIAGAIRYNAAKVEFCNGTDWAAFNAGALDATLTSLAGFNTNGMMVQTAADTFTARSIAGTSNRVAVTNGDGVAGNPTIDIPTALLPSPVVGDVGKFLKATAADTSVWTALGLSDVTTALGFTPINLAGDSITTGTFTLSGTAVLRSPDPVGLTDVANKQYVDSYGQWTKSGSDIYRLSDNVGIGTATPETPLHVLGTIQVGATASYYSMLQQNTLAFNRAANPSYIDQRGVGGSLIFRTSNATSYDTHAMTLLANGNVGIGTSSPTSILELSNATPSLNIKDSDAVLHAAGHHNKISFKDSADAVTGFVGFSTSGEAMALYNYNDGGALYLGNNGGPQLSILNSGNVGVGTSTPTDKLHVVGDVYVTGQVKSRGQLWREVLSIPDPTTTTNGYKIKTTIPVASKMVTLKIEGSHATYSDPILSYISFYYYSGVVYAPKVFSIGSGSALTNVKIGVENGYFTVFFSPVSYIAYMSVSILNTAGAYQNFPETNLTGWTYADEAATDPSYVAADTGMSFAGHMNILNNGNVGIGTTAPTAKLHLNGTDGRAITVSPGTTSQSLNFIHNDNGNVNARYANINAALANGGSGYNYGHLTFSTAPDTTGNPATIERMRITGSGNVGVGTTAPAYKFQVGAAADGSEARANAWNSLSDERLKRDFEIIPESLEKILSLNGYYYYWNRGTDTSKKLGLKAQEVEKVFPEVVSHGADGFLSVSYNHLVAGIIEAVKEFFFKWQGDSKGIHREIASLKKNNELLKKDNELLRRKNLETDARLKKLEQAILKKN